MADLLKQLWMTEEDLLGYAPEAALCIQCSSGCGFRIARVMDGEAFIVCGRKKATEEILAHLGRR